MRSNPIPTHYLIDVSPTFLLFQNIKLCLVSLRIRCSTPRIRGVGCFFEVTRDDIASVSVDQLWCRMVWFADSGGLGARNSLIHRWMWNDPGVRN